MSDFSILKAKAKTQLQGNWGTMACILLAEVGISFGCAILSLPLGIIGSILSIFVSTWSTMVWGNASLKLAKGEPIAVGDIFEFMPRLPSVTWTSFLSGLMLYGWSLLVGIPYAIIVFWVGSPVMLLLAPFVVILPIVKGLSYSQMIYIALDNPTTTGTEPINRSREMMDGYKWMLFKLNLTFIGWKLLTILTLGLLSFYTVPYMNTTFANFYLELRGEQNPWPSANTPATDYNVQRQWQSQAR